MLSKLMPAQQEQTRMWIGSRLTRTIVVGLIAGVCSSSTWAEQQTFELGDEGFKQVQAPDPNTPEGQLHLIRAAIADDNGDDAIDMATDWIDNHPNHPLLPEAYLLRGDARTSINHYFKALFDYELLIRSYPESSQFNQALERELKIADAYASGVKRRLWGMRIMPATGEAEELYIRIQERAPGKRIAEEAGIKLADYYYERSKMRSAADAYDLFLQNYPQSQWREHAMQRQVLANLATFKGPRFDATGLIEGQRRLEEYKRQYPAAAERIGADALLTRIDETLATRDLLVAQWYEHTKDRVSAAFTYRRLIKDHPASAAARTALQRLQELEPAAFAEAAAAQSTTAPLPEPGSLDKPEQPATVKPVDETPPAAGASELPTAPTSPTPATEGAEQP
ncbi:outer membrane protein assembly factor BamD [Planctomycetales bacterium ZRK34]|nr:outer membrane protein assembly factor BamD [Planctomycetales bacterium ZRK34]